MSVVHTLKELSKNRNILIVDDNARLRAQLKEFLERFFSNVHSVEDGELGIEIFKKHQLDIIVTDIQMPKVNGMEMLKVIKSIDWDIPVIVMSAYDEKEYLFESIKHGVVNYLKKPTKINELCEVLIDTLQRLKIQNEKKLFDRYTHDIFKEQNSLILLYENNSLVIANPAFLEFFDVATLKEFNNKYLDLGLLLLKQDEFLYNSDEDWFSKVSRQSGDYFHAKILDKNAKNHHFLLKYINISDSEGYGLLTLDDISDLNLLSLFENVSDNESELFGDTDTINNAIKLIMQKNVPIKVHNFYKGLSITNPVKIISFEDGVITLEANKNQLIASRYEKGLIIGSNTLPNFIWCDEIVDFNEELQHIKVTNLKFMRSNPTKRKNIRLVPENDYKISLFFKLKEFLGDISIVDLSVEGMKLKVNSLLVGMRDGESIEAIITLARKSDNLNLDIHSKILRIDKYDTYYHVTIEFDLDYDTKEMLTAYISKRQMQLIREFKLLE